MNVKEPSAFQIERALAAWKEARNLQISAGNIDHDDPLARAEDDINDVVTRLAIAARHADHMIDACDRHIAEIEQSKSKWINRKDSRRKLLEQLLDLLGKRSHKDGGVLVGYRSGTPSVIITNPAKVPDRFKSTRVEILIDKRAIGKAMAQDGEVFDFAELSNAPDILFIRSI